MKKMILRSIITSVVTLAVFFISYSIDGLKVAVIATAFTVVALADFSLAVAALTITVIAAFFAPTAPTSTVVALFVVTLAVAAVVSFATEIKNRKIPFSQIAASYTVEATLLYGIIMGFLDGATISVWLPTLIMAVVSISLFGVVPAIRLYSRMRCARLEKRA